MLKKAAEKYVIKVGDVMKLIPNLGDKINDVLHYRNLQKKNYAANHEFKPVLTLSTPICVGFTVLELSKWLMYDFHCKFIKKKFDVELLFTDTDSLMHEIKSEDAYEEFFKHKHLLDFTN